jgi:transglutaminase-like putative cysteine protease
VSATVTYRVTHRTEYEYESTVTASYSQLHLLPRELPGQRCRHSELAIEPAPDAADYRERTDFFGNRVAFVAIDAPHRSFAVTATSVVEVDDRSGGLSLLGEEPWETARDALHDGRTGDAFQSAQFVLDSPLVAAAPAFARYALPSFTAGRPLAEAARDLCSRVHGDFAYRPGATSVRTPLSTVFARREGVCQDFAHVAIAALRSIGLPARYVSGYLETDPPPGRPKLTGADVSHAWFSVLVPGAGWLDLDPTNDQLAGSRYVVTAFGRDYGDVPPLSGIVYSEGRTESPRVRVDVVALPAE